MTLTIQATDSIGAGAQFSFLANDDSCLILPGVTVGSTVGAAIEFGAFIRLTLDIGGTLVSEDQLVAVGNDVAVTVGAAGRFLSYEASSGNVGIFLSGDGSSIDNAGEIVAQRSIAILSNGGNDVTNSGAITGASPVFLGLFGTVGDTLVNSGWIAANRNSDASNDTRYNNGVFAEGPDTRITNLAGGIITAVSTEGAGVRLGLGANGSTVVNDGTIEATVWYGVDFNEMSASEFARLTNTGTIRGVQGSFIGNDTTDVVVNRGTMTGTVLLGEGDDRFDGRGGRVEGDVWGNGGDDAIDLRGASFVSGSILGGAGLDLIRGSEFDDTIEGEGDNDTLRGAGGDDSLDGGTENDDLGGGAGDDTLTGGAGADVLAGGTGDDIYVNPTGDTIIEAAGAAGGEHDAIRTTASFNLATAANVEDIVLTGFGNVNAIGNNFANILTGNSGNNTINASGGNDTIAGGAGNDTLNGGAGADLFKFATAGAGADTINAFETALDKFNLSGGTFSARVEAGGSTTLTHAGGTIVVTAVAGLTLAQWNALVVGSGREAQQRAAVHDDAIHAPTHLGTFGAADFLYA